MISEPWKLSKTGKIKDGGSEKMAVRLEEASKSSKSAEKQATKHWVLAWTVIVFSHDSPNASDSMSTFNAYTKDFYTAS